MKSNEEHDVQTIDTGVTAGKLPGIKAVREKLENGRGNLQKVSSRMLENMSNSIHKRAEETNEFIDSVKNKNSKIKNLENLLDLDKNLLVSSDKTTSFYKYSRDKIVIVDKDILGDPCGVTVKEGLKVRVFTVKFEDYTPFIYPSYDERDISGEIIYMDKDEIWYRDMDKLTLGYNNGNSMEFRTVRLSSLEGFSDANLVQYIKKYAAVMRSPKISELVKDNSIEINNIIKLNDNYVIAKNKDSGYTIYVYSYASRNFDELPLRRLPNIQLGSYDMLLAPDMLKFIKENDYPIEDFIEKNGYIEYNREVGRTNVSVIRFKL